MYSASLLRKCAKVYKDTVLTVENHLVKEIKAYALDPDILEIEDIFPREFPEKQNFKDTMKKLSIISQLYSRELVDYLSYNQGQGILSQLFGGQFANENVNFEAAYEKHNLP